MLKAPHFDRYPRTTRVKHGGLVRLCTFVYDRRTRIGAQTAAGIVDLQAADPALPVTMLELLQGGDEALARARRAAESPRAEHVRAQADVTLLPPVPNPAKIVCIGLNYRDHAAEVNLPLPEHVTVFAKWPNTLIGDGAEIVIPPESHRVDYEAELAFVVGSARAPRSRSATRTTSSPATRA